MCPLFRLRTVWKLADLGSLRHCSTRPQVRPGEVGFFGAYSTLCAPSRDRRQGAASAKKRLTMTAGIKILKNPKCLISRYL